MSGVLDLGHGYVAEPREGDDGGLYGFIVTGNAAEGCRQSASSTGRCGGWVPIATPDGWTLESRDPLTLSPSIRCACGGQHIFVRGGRAELCGDDRSER